MRFDAFFKSGSGGHNPYPYQVRLAEQAWPETLVVPTGFGKTAAVLAAWLWKIWKTGRGDAGTPRRLVYCLPMRTLVEQTESAAQRWIEAAKTELGLEVGLDVLMGGRSGERRGLPEWMLCPERPAILAGTQDLLVSAALMRAYGTSRYRWPVDFALLHNDALWVFDEVQLTGATLATSAQLEAFRRKFGSGRDCRTLWMSATLDPAWLKTVDFAPADTHRAHDLDAADLDGSGHLWRARKRLRHLDPGCAAPTRKDELKAYAAALAMKTTEVARAGTNTILFLNTVPRAQAVFAALRKNSDYTGQLLLVHSRFRKAGRDQRMQQLREDPPATGRIIVATQALEAGVDVTATTMVTEIAPWSSLVQRFGRCNRRGECGEAGADIFWVDVPATEAAARPYRPGDIANARKVLATLSACGPSDLAAIPPSAPARGAVIRQRDLLDLFDTDPDLAGFDVDVSLYVRDADDTDVRLFWRPVAGDAWPPEDAPAPVPAELCPAPVGRVKELLKRKSVRAWTWDTLARAWRGVRKDTVFPGMTLWLDAASGGYDPEQGFDTTAKKSVEPVPPPDMQEAAIDDDPDTYTGKVRVSLAKHSVHVRDQAEYLAMRLGLNGHEREMLRESALWHDLGKTHATFRARCGLTAEDAPLAKTPDYQWRRPDARNRRYFRHELASALACLAHHQWSDRANLVAWLIAAHHGKVRMRLRALPNEKGPPGRLFARGVHDGDILPATGLGAQHIPETVLDLDIMPLGEGKNGPSWQARAQGLLAAYGPFRLAWYEALLRIADWRASKEEEEAGHDDL